MFIISFFILGYLGTIPPSKVATVVAQICTVLYFAYFVLMPWYTRVEADQARTGQGDDAMKRSTLAVGIVAGAGARIRLERGSIDWKMQPFKPNLQDKPSLQRGARLFVNYCMGCHSLKFQRYERTADDLEIPHDIFMANLVFTGQKIGGADVRTRCRRRHRRRGSARRRPI